MYEVTIDLAQWAYYFAAAVATYYALQFSSILLPTGGEQVVVSEELAEEQKVRLANLIVVHL